MNHIKKMDLKDITYIENAPKFDHIISLKPKTSYPARRKVQYPKLNPTAETIPKKTHKINRQDSTEMTQNKRTKTGEDHEMDST